MFIKEKKINYKKAWKSLFLAQSEEVVDLPILSGSMDPLIQLGDLIRVCPCKAGSLHLSDIAVFRSGNKIFAHRVIFKLALGTKLWILEKGDRNFYPTWLKKQDVLGKVVKVFKKNHDYSLEDPIKRYEQRQESRRQLAHFLLRVLSAPGRLLKHFLEI